MSGDDFERMHDWSVLDTENMQAWMNRLGLVWKIGKAELNQQNRNSGNVNESEKRRIQFVISGGDSAKPFELLETAFNQMLFFV